MSVRPEYLTTEEVAEMMRLSYQQVVRMAQRGDLPAIKTGREWRFRSDILDRYVEQEMNKRVALADA